jgi:Fe-S-cluster formation regulator IscX/YfhJ
VGIIPKATVSKPKKKEEPLNKVGAETIKLITESVNDLADESGWAPLASLGNFIIKKKPDFDPRNYGFPKLLPLIKSINKFEIDHRDSGVNNIKHIYLRQK